MQAALDAYEDAILRVHALHALHGSLSAQVTPALDLTDILRAEVVLSVSAFDFFVHELTRLGMLAIFAGTRAPSDAYQRFQIPMKTASSLSEQSFDAEIRSKNGYAVFQHPDKISEAIRLISSIDLWELVAIELGTDKKAIKSAFSLVVDRRNKIAHEADRDPSYPSTLWPIDRSQVDYILGFVDRVAHAIFKVVV
jgi:hypothetical protein